MSCEKFTRSPGPVTKCWYQQHYHKGWQPKMSLYNVPEKGKVKSTLPPVENYRFKEQVFILLSLTLPSFMVEIKESSNQG